MGVGICRAAEQSQMCCTAIRGLSCIWLVIALLVFLLHYNTYIFDALMHAKGTLTIIPMKASIQPKLTSRMFQSYTSPLIRFKLDKQIRETKVCSRGGLNPHWDQTITLKKRKSNTLFVVLIDHRTIMIDQIIGKAELDISGVVLSNNSTTHQFWIKKDDKVTGKVTLTLHFEKNTDTGEKQQLIASEKHPQLNIHQQNEAQGLQIQNEEQSIEEDKMERLITIRETCVSSRRLIEEEIVTGRQQDKREEKVGLSNPVLNPMPHPIFGAIGRGNQDPFSRGGMNFIESLLTSGSQISCQDIKIATSIQFVQQSFTRVSDVTRMDYLFESQASKPILARIQEQLENCRIYTPSEMDRILDSGSNI